MDYKVNDDSPVETKVEVSVGAEEVNASLVATAALYRQSTDMPGFRKGKVPTSLIESKFRKQILQEAANELINVHINEIMSAKKYLAVGKLDVSQVDMEKDTPLSYTITFEHAPAFDLPPYKGLAVEEEEAVAGDADINHVVERIRRNLADYKAVKQERLPADGDMVVLSFFATQGGKRVPGVAAENFQLSLGEGQALPEFEALVKTILPGQSGKADMAFPEDFINQGLAGKTVEMEISVHLIKERELPEANDEMAKKAGSFAGLAEMREAIAKSYVASRQQLYTAAAQKKLLDEILASVDFMLPPSLVQERLANLMADAHSRLERAGKSPEAVGKTNEELEKDLTPQAEEMVKTQLFLLAVADKEGIQTTPQEFEAYFKQVAARTGQDVIAIKQHYESHNLIIPVRDKILADKAMDFIYSLAMVSKVPAKEIKEIKDNQDNA